MTAKGSTRYARGIGVVGLSIALVLGVGGLGSAMAAKAKVAVPEAPGPLGQAIIALDKLMTTGEFNMLSDAQLLERLAEIGVFSGKDSGAIRSSVLAQIKARRLQVVAGTQIEGLDLSTGIGRTADNPIRVHALNRKDHYENGAEKSAWAFENNADQSRSGFYPLPNSDSITIYSYENDLVFRTEPASMSTSNMMDIITFGGSCPMPPEGIYSIETLFRTYGTQVNGLRSRIRFWSSWNPAAAAGVSVVSNQVGPTIDLDYGHLPVSLFWLDIITLSPPIFPTHNDNIGIQFTYTDNVTGAVTSTTHWFAFGPPIGPLDTPLGPPASGSGPPTGSSGNFFYADVNVDGVLTSDESRLFSTTAPGNFANVNLHIGGFPPAGEVEPNDTNAGANALCPCDDRDSVISSAVDNDKYKFTLNGPLAVQFTVSCGSSVTLTLRDSAGTIVAGPTSGACPQQITTSVLPAGTYFLEVLGNGVTIPKPYHLQMRSLATAITGMKFTTATTKDHVVWDPQANSTYDVIRGNIAQLHSSAGNFASPSVVTDCWDVDLTIPQTIDTTVPTGPANSLFYLARSKNACALVSSYDEPGVITSRDPGIAANPNACP